MSVVKQVDKEIQKTLPEVYIKHPWNTKKKFLPEARKEKYDDKESKKFLKNEVIHDQKVPKPKFMSIYSKTPGGYQMDTFIKEPFKGGKNYLMFININTRKAYAYPMEGKTAPQVRLALEKFIKDVPEVKSIESDQDSAYLSNTVLDFMKKHNIKYTTTTDDNHNNLGIVNRFMRTIRDMAAKRGLMNEQLWSHLNKDGDL